MFLSLRLSSDLDSSSYGAKSQQELIDIRLVRYCQQMPKGAAQKAILALAPVSALPDALAEQGADSPNAVGAEGQRLDQDQSTVS